jgi:AcrR family transcriptional regulator
MKRNYESTQREQQAAQTAQRIVDAAEDLVREKSLHELTLNDIAATAGVSVQTVIRKYGGREGVLEAMATQVRDRIQVQRRAAPRGDVRGAIDNLLQHYEAEGDLILQLLTQETTSSFATAAAREGRAFHRAWVQDAFFPSLKAPNENDLDSLVMVTDIFAWRLLRRDLGRSLAQTRAVLIKLTEAFLKDPQ